MALIHTDAHLTPTKLDLLAAWLPAQDWAGAGEVRRVATFRLDDPAGEVGMETFLLQVGDRLVHVPLTYRDAPLEGGVLVGETEHSAIGHRWVYDAPSDAVYRAVVTATIRDGGREAAMVAADGTPLPAPADGARVRGSGGPIGSGAVLDVRRAPEPGGEGPGTLTATWAGQEEPVVLVSLA